MFLSTVVASGTVVGASVFQCQWDGGLDGPSVVDCKRWLKDEVMILVQGSNVVIRNAIDLWQYFNI